MVTTTEAAEITTLTKKINSTWLSEESKKALSAINLTNFDTVEELEDWLYRDCEDSNLSRKANQIIYDQL